MHIYEHNGFTDNLADFSPIPIKFKKTWFWLKLVKIGVVDQLALLVWSLLKILVTEDSLLIN